LRDEKPPHPADAAAFFMGRSVLSWAGQSFHGQVSPFMGKSAQEASQQQAAETTQLVFRKFAWKFLK
jgi:hypothetical protein